MCPRTDGDESCVFCEARRHLPLSSTFPLRVPFTEASQRRSNAKPQPLSWAPRKQASRRCLWLAKASGLYEVEMALGAAGRRTWALGVLLLGGQGASCSQRWGILPSSTPEASLGISLPPAPLPSGQSPRSKVHSQLLSRPREFQPAWLQQLTCSWSSTLTLCFVPHPHAWTADACDGPDGGAGDVVGRRAACG